jgi:YbgC/YbaW family acyl-CoA thioester hydrolase
MTFESKITVRGYELDSFGHVNNAVYLNYCEHARWEMLKKKNLLDFFSAHELILVVVEADIRYIKEAKPFDELLVRTGTERKSPYLVFNHIIEHAAADEVIARAKIKTVLVDKDRIPHDIPDLFIE